MEEESLRSPEHWLFRLLPLTLVVPVAVTAIGAALVGIGFGLPWWAGWLIGLGVSAIALFPIRGGTLAGFLADRVSFRRQRRRRGTPVAHHAAFDAPLPDGGSYGLRWDDTRLISTIRIDSAPKALTLLKPGGTPSDEVVPLVEIARCLDQFDIDLAAVDVISSGSRTVGANAVARLYEQILGPLPAIAHRTVWVVLRLDPLANARAVDSRGGGSTGALRTALVATRRVANRLAGRGFSVSVLSAAEMNAMVGQLTAGTLIDRLTETPQSVSQDGLYFTSYQLSSELLGPSRFAEIWATSSLATTLTLRLRPVIEQDRRTDEIALSGVVRFDTRSDFTEPPVPGLKLLRGKQYRALLDTLPIGVQGPELVVDQHYGAPTALGGIAIPTAGCGQLIGADSSGNAVVVPMFGPQLRRVELIGSLHLAQQVILRAMALGAKVVVYTNRHDAWRYMVSNVGNPEQLTLAAWAAGSQQANAYQSANMIVFDRMEPSTYFAGATLVSLYPQPLPDSEADVTLTQDPGNPSLVTVVTPDGTATARIVATPNEMNYIGSPVQTSVAV